MRRRTKLPMTHALHERSCQRRPPAADAPAERAACAGSFWALTLGSVGVVYGDIGTSPLYAFREAVMRGAPSAGPVTRDDRARRAVADPLGADPRRHASNTC